MDKFVDVAFQLRGKSISLDHGYALFSAVSRVLPRVHEEKTWGLHPVYGRRGGQGELHLLPQSQLTIRLPSQNIGDVLTLAGKTLEVDGHQVTVGIPKVFPLQPRALLKSRFVTIKKFHDDTETFGSAVQRQLETLGCAPSAKVAVGARRVIRVGDHSVVGFSVGIEGLDADSSILVQTVGIGGRRHMGAGVFLSQGFSERQ
jgi:CRISPR-associated protein Cas6